MIKKFLEWLNYNTFAFGWERVQTYSCFYESDGDKQIEEIWGVWFNPKKCEHRYHKCCEIIHIE